MVDTINPAITAGIGSQQGNPLDLLARYAYTQNALLQGQYVRAKQAAGTLYQQSIGPDGTPDMDKFTTLLAAHPETSMVAPELLTEMSRLRAINAETTQTNLNIAGERAQRAANIFFAIGKDPTMRSMTDVTPYISQGLAEGAFDPKKPQEMIAFMSDPKYANLKDQQFRDFMTNHGFALLQGAQGLQAVTQTYQPNAIQNPDGSTSGAWTTPSRGTAVPAILGAAGAMSAGPTAGAAAAGAPDQTAQAGPAPFLGTQSPLRAEQLRMAGEYGQNVDQRAGAAQSLVLEMRQVQDLLKHFDPNRAATIRAEMGSILNAAGAPKDLQDKLANGDLSSSIAARKLFFGIGGGVAARLLHDANSRGSQLLISRALNEASPNIDMPEGAINKIMNAMEETANVTRLEREHFYARKNQQNYDMTNVQRDWGETLDHYLAQRPGLE